MPRRSKQEWRALIEEQARSGQNAATFCRAHGINEKYFYSVKHNLKIATRPPSGFVKLTQPRPTRETICLHYQGLQLEFTGVPEQQWLAHFIKTLVA